ncbi:LysR family transcriptional regulator [Sediminibacillus halophilus]|uniref:DNA-binding transcriptional regulator, LysR family n=1 Tax=Sediminibacillus halophilus TaxID=482461 RepID=A0A1G9P303_9BACI|nr:LysR family transcriptional regulator [Sediminibacillus halophilus]SDL92933.1 DNA-binding transcriptional regulator, LysR family [Sediminibacillus halophilus]
MELRQLHYFLEVAKQQGITKAAESLHISQPALSKMIKALEEELGMTLIVRSNKTSELTDAGMVVREYAKKIQGQLDDMTTILNDLTQLERGAIHIGLPPIIGSLFFPNVLSAFHKKYPNIKITITEYGGAKVVKSVEEGELDVAVAVLPVDDEIFNIYPIVEEKMNVVVPQEHRFANRKSIDLMELKDEEFIFYHEDFALHDIIMEKFIQAGYHPDILFKSSQWDLMAEMVAANLGITILPDSICNKVKNSGLHILKVNPTIPWNLAVITKKEKYISYASRTFIEFIQQMHDSI